MEKHRYWKASDNPKQSYQKVKDMMLHLGAMIVVD